ncbi:MAG: hypothetical protein HY240_09880, partial [Actinobacteria bacterium]|nr:hypothetical protein [Actinomycetota bacterium]
GPTVLFSSAAVLAVLGAVVAWFALDVPALSRPSPVPVVGPGIQPEPGRVP